MDMNNNEISIVSSSSAFHCRYAPQVSWEVKGSAFHLITGLTTIMASFPTIVLNAFIILAIKQRRELQKPSNLMLSSLAVTDLLVGIIVMPATATIDFFTLSQVSFEHSCMLYGVNIFFTPLLFTATLHHLTIISWERYVAVQKWKDYKRIITNGRLKKIAIGTWLCAFFPAAAYFAMAAVSGDPTILRNVLTGWAAVETVCLFLVAFFYRKVYLGISNCKLNETYQIDVLIKAKLESKVAKTTGLLTAAIISLFIPLFVFAILGNVVSLLRTNAAIRFTQLATQLNSSFNPLLYCYRDHRFRNAFRELLGTKKSHAIQSAVGAAQFIRQKDTFKSSELHIVGKHTQRLTRSVSCNLTDAFYSIHDKPSVVMLKRSLSAPTLDACSSSLDSLDPQQPIHTLLKQGAMIHGESGARVR